MKAQKTFRQERSRTDFFISKKTFVPPSEKKNRGQKQKKPENIRKEEKNFLPTSGRKKL
jgi:hypothetical protein